MGGLTILWIILLLSGAMGCVALFRLIRLSVDIEELEEPPPPDADTPIDQ